MNNFCIHGKSGGCPKCDPIWAGLFPDHSSTLAMKKAAAGEKIARAAVLPAHQYLTLNPNASAQGAAAALLAEVRKNGWDQGDRMLTILINGLPELPRVRLRSRINEVLSRSLSLWELDEERTQPQVERLLERVIEVCQPAGRVA